jgi:5'(3')-deoxyribonucleotidase
MTKRIAIDMDGVQVDLIASVLRYINTVFYPEKNFTHEDITEFDFAKSLGIPSEHAIEYFSTSQAFGPREKPIGGAVEGMKTLSEHPAVDLYIATSPWYTNKDCHNNKRDWIRKYMPWFDQRHVVFCSKKQVLNVDAIVDDKYDTVVNCLDAGIEHGILFDQPWNRKYKVSGKGFVRVRGWDELITHILERVL